MGLRPTVSSGGGGLQDPGGGPLGNGGSKPRPGEGGQVGEVPSGLPSLTQEQT